MVMDTDMEDTVVDMVDMVITARGMLRLSPRLMLRPPLLPSLDTDTTVTDMVTVLTDTSTARGLLMPSPDMVSTATVDTGTDTDTVTDTEDTTTARGPLMPSPDMVTTAEDTDSVDTG